MARGARRLFGSTWALSATGYAGPDGGGPDRPPGTTVLCLAGPDVETIRELNFPGTRDVVRQRSCRSALDMLRRALLEEGAVP
jgi:nicotinamide-nucleotide amidase